jgi:hypothetical protein
LEAGVGGRAVARVQAGQEIAASYGLTWFGHAVHADEVIDAGFFGKPAATQVANDLADDSGVALGDEPGTFGVELADFAGEVIVLELLPVNFEVRALGLEHGFPAAERFSGVEALLDSSGGFPGIGDLAG